MIVAIDGPAGSGKTTVARLLAQALGFGYLDTGATYRALTLQALEEGGDLGDEAWLAGLAENLDLRFEAERVILAGRDVTDQIRLPRIDKNISCVVSFPGVRAQMVIRQRGLAASVDFVVEGRDITTVVFPDAKFKFYLDADSTVRARRRHKELKAQGVEIDFEELRQDLMKRDQSDMTRSISPLRLAQGTTRVDTTSLSIAEVVAKLKAHIKNG